MCADAEGAFSAAAAGGAGHGGEPVICLDWQVPHYNTLSRRQKDLVVMIPYRPHGEPLHLVIASTGLKVLSEGEWKVRRHGADKRRVWRKVHLVVDADSHEVRAVEMTNHHHGDSGTLPGLLAEMPEEKRIPVISSDGAYDTRTAYAASASRKAALLVLPRRNGRPWKARTAGAEERNETLCAIKPLGADSGNDEAATTAAASPRRPCHASNAWVSGSRPATPHVRSPRCRSAAPS